MPAAVGLLPHPDARFFRQGPECATALMTPPRDAAGSLRPAVYSRGSGQEHESTVIYRVLEVLVRFELTALGSTRLETR